MSIFYRIDKDSCFSNIYDHKWLTAGSIAIGIVGAVTQSSAITIKATFSTTDTFNAAQIATIKSVIQLYDAFITNNITVNIFFDNTSAKGLGFSEKARYTLNYANYLTKLTNDSSEDAIDTAALKQLNADPYMGRNVDVASANSRALGYRDPGTLNVQGKLYDGYIALDGSQCFSGHSNPDPNKYDLFADAAHEIDEVLGTGSGVGRAFTNADLFRYQALNTRSFTTSATVHSYFSVDGTITNSIEEYNQFERTKGDYGDWVKHNPAQVQDWDGTKGKIENVGYGEVSLLDAIGYNIDQEAVPEPAPIAILGLGLIALVFRRRK